MDTTLLRRIVVTALTGVNILLLARGKAFAQYDPAGKCTTCIENGEKWACCEAGCRKDCNCNFSKDCKLEEE